MEVNKVVNVLIIGGGGREHVLAKKISESDLVNKVYGVLGNDGMRDVATIFPKISETDFKSLEGLVRDKNIGLTVVGPEVPLVMPGEEQGIVDYWESSGLINKGHFIFGHRQLAAQLEGKKAFAKRFMKRHGIPTAPFKIFDNSSEAEEYVKKKGAPIVVKASGLAAGKGSIVCHTLDQALDAIYNLMDKDIFKGAGKEIVIEDFMEGEEASILALTDGKTILTLIPSQDYKPIRVGGKNTGGMGAYSPVPIVNEEVMKDVYKNILVPTIDGMNSENIPFKGCIYAGLMIKNGKSKVVEYNIRFGDPEAQPVLTLLENDLFELLYACTQGNLGDYKITNKDGAASCVVMASGGYPDKYETGKVIKGLDLVTSPDVYVFHAGTKLVNGEFVTDGGRVVGVTGKAIGKGRTISEAVETTYKKGVDLISWKDEYHRKDIGRINAA